MSQQDETSNPNTEEEFWRKVWKLKISGAAKQFLWRACLDILRTMMNLVKRKIAEHPKCPICDQSTKTLLDSLWECSAANDV